ncbi:hypothetical protein BASA81_006582 [Batrachochytrium salamandrivorans]|nr:hypothetical protein BASA81_006582 [Batrachochytrium salamandrivorans]
MNQMYNSVSSPSSEHRSSPPSAKVYLSLLALCLCNAVDGIETLAFGAVLTGFVNPGSGQRLDKEPWLSAMLTTSVFIGMLVGGLVAGRLADKFGRKPILLCCMLLNATCGLGSFFTPLLPIHVMRQVFWLFGFRLVGGLGIGGSIPCTYALVAELTDTNESVHHRERRVTILGTAWTLGSIFTATSAWWMLDPKDNTKTWPWFFFWCSTMAWTALGLTWAFVHETHILTPHQDVDGEGEDFPKFQVVCFCLVWFAQNFGSYGPLIWIGTIFAHLGYEDPYLVSLLASSFALVGNLVAYLTMHYVSHKLLLIVGMGISACAALGFGLPGLPSALTVLSACVFTASVGLSWISLGVLSAEAFPTRVRATYFGASSAFGRLGSITANGVNPLLLAHGLILPLAGLVLLLGASIVWKGIGAKM